MRLLLLCGRYIRLCGRWVDGPSGEPGGEIIILRRPQDEPYVLQSFAPGLPICMNCKETASGYDRLGFCGMVDLVECFMRRSDRWSMRCGVFGDAKLGVGEKCFSTAVGQSVLMSAVFQAMETAGCLTQSSIGRLLVTRVKGRFQTKVRVEFDGWSNHFLSSPGVNDGRRHGPEGKWLRSLILLAE